MDLFVLIHLSKYIVILDFTNYIESLSVKSMKEEFIVMMQYAKWSHCREMQSFAE